MCYIYTSDRYYSLYYYSIFFAEAPSGRDRLFSFLSRPELLFIIRGYDSFIVGEAKLQEEDENTVEISRWRFNIRSRAVSSFVFAQNNSKVINVWCSHAITDDLVSSSIIHDFQIKLWPSLDLTSWITQYPENPQNDSYRLIISYGDEGFPFSYSIIRTCVWKFPV